MLTSKTKAAERKRLLSPYASELEHCSTVVDGVAVMERMLDAVRAVPEPHRLDDVIGHFADWLGEVGARERIEASTEQRVMAVVDGLTAVSTQAPLADDTSRIRRALDAMRAR